MVTFDYASWAQLYPEFASVSQAQIMGRVLPLAEGYALSCGCGSLNDAAMQTNLLNLLVAHITQLFFGVNGQGASGRVGRISGATEGSVSVQTDYPSNPNSAWWNQTPFGAMFWQMMSACRLFQYRSPRGYGLRGYGGYGGRGFGGGGFGWPGGGW